MFTVHWLYSFWCFLRCTYRVTCTKWIIVVITHTYTYYSYMYAYSLHRNVYETHVTKYRTYFEKVPPSDRSCVYVLPRRERVDQQWSRPRNKVRSTLDIGEIKERTALTRQVEQRATSRDNFLGRLGAISGVYRSINRKYPFTWNAVGRTFVGGFAGRGRGRGCGPVICFRDGLITAER